MDLIHFGWSACDIIKAIEIIWGIAEAFDNAKGARAKYATSSAFLRGLVPVLQRIQLCVESPDQTQLQKDILAQGVIIREAYVDFEGYLDKRIGLSSPVQGTGGKLRYITQAVFSAFDEMQGKVQNLQTKVVNAMAFIGPIPALEINAKIEQISQNMDNNSEDNQIHFAKLLESIRDQTSALETISLNYKEQLAEATKEDCQSREAETAKIQSNVKDVRKSQEKLEDGLKLLTQQIDRQHRESMSATEAASWARLGDVAAMQRKSLDDAKDSTSNTIRQTQTAFDGLAKISGNEKFAIASERISGISAIWGIATSFLERVKTKAPDTTSDSSARSQGPLSEPIYRTPNPGSSKTGSARLHKANQVDGEVNHKNAISASLRIKPPPRKPGTQFQNISPNQLVPPPSRTGQRPFVASRPSQRSQPYNIPINITVEGQAAPPLPPRSTGGSESRSKSADNAKLRPCPSPKPSSLRLPSTSCSSRARSPGSSLDIQEEDISDSMNTLHLVPRMPAPAAPRSSYDSLSSRQSRSSSGIAPSSTTTYTAQADLETDVRDRESFDEAKVEAESALEEGFMDDGSLGSPELLSFADKRKHLEYLLSRR
ncbi:MAG: hypothetical protein Q9199_007160 [Rusavskia elegans]